MNCKICGTDNPEDAVFCKACGKRLSDAAVCPECSATIPADSVFCPYCGKAQSVATPQTITAPQTLATAEPVAVNAVAAMQTATEDKKENKNFKTFLKYAIPATALMTALLALIFVFFTGYVGTSFFNFGGSISSNKNNLDIFYYLGDAYKTIAKVFDKLDSEGTPYSDYFASSSYIPTVFGTIIASLTLVSVCLLAILAIVQSIRFFSGKTQKTGGSLAIAAFFAYLAGALALFALNNYYIKSESSFDGMQIISIGECKLNGATLAGISLCTVFAILYTGFTVASRGRELLKVHTIIKCILSLVGVALIIAIIAVCAKPAISMDVDENAEGKVQYGVMYLLGMLVIECMDWEVCEAVLNLNEVTAYTIISFTMMIVTIVLATRALAGFAKKITVNNGRTHLIVCILFTICALLYMAFTIATGKEFLKSTGYLGSSSNKGSFGYTLPIVTFVFAAVALAVSVAQYCLSRKKHAGQAEEQVEEAETF